MLCAVALLGVAVAAPLEATAQDEESEEQNFTPYHPVPEEESGDPSDEETDDKKADDRRADEDKAADDDEQKEGDSEEKTPTSTSPTESDDSKDDDPSKDAPRPESQEVRRIENPVEYCDQYMTQYLESAGRKLYRALSGENFSLEKLGGRDHVEIAVPNSSGDQVETKFMVVPEKEGRVAALVDTERNHRRTAVLAMTDSGPVIAILDWPDRSEIDQRADCAPVQSRVARPPGTSDEIDIDPFKYWGLRVVWRIPNSFANGSYDGPDIWEAAADVLSEPNDL